MNVLINARAAGGTRMPPQKKSNKPVASRPLSSVALLLFLFTLVWGIPTLWLGLSPPNYALSDWLSFDINRRLNARTRIRLNILQKAMASYVTSYAVTPPSLSHLRAFMAAERKNFPGYDAFGARFDYHRLADDAFVLRSFGKDGMQNSLMSTRDLSVTSLPATARRGLTFKYAKAAQLDLFPAVYLLSADSPNRLWQAQLFVDKHQGKKQLLVRHTEKLDLLMLAPHDAVEEYLWLPNSDQIVYTATGSQRYRDGLYLWNLRDDTAFDLTPWLTLNNTKIGTNANLATGTPGQAISKWFLSLAGISINGPTLYVYGTPRRDGQALSPQEFFAKANLTAIKIPEKYDAASLSGPSSPASLNSELDRAALAFTKELHLDEHIDLKQDGTRDGPPGSKTQQAWLQLRLHGDMEKTLLDWQDFCEKAANSPLLPYCLWYLSSLYGESFTLIAAQELPGNNAAPVLRTYGTELARALADYALAPTYLRGLGLYTYDRLMAGNPLPYRFANLTVGMAKDAVSTINPSAVPIKPAPENQESDKK